MRGLAVQDRQHADEDVDEVMSVTGPWGMIVKGADNEARWYVSKRFFELNYERAKRQCEACRGRGVLIAIDDVSEKCTYCNGKGWIAL